ncbi:MAG TPA: TonB-dependent receptor [Chitinophagaceae bacterium]|nr:TonB-dependent receptor [Chitinophagaceae bacterium]
MKFYTLMLTLLLATAFTTQAQQKHSISGTIKDKKNGEDLIGATISVTQLKGTGTRSNTYGFYSLTLPQGNYELKVSAIGFTTQYISIELNKDIQQDIQLESVSSNLKEVKVKATRKDQNVTDAQMGMTKLNMTEINKIPVLMGERDVIKTMTLLPGIKSAGEGNTGFNVRGGASDQNLILLDEAPVYNASHLLGFFSTFNSDAIKDVQIYKGGMPAEYGGRLSSVLDIKMKEGNDKNYSVSGGLGLISSRLNIEGPIVKEKGSFIITGRRTYVDQFLKLSNKYKDNKLYFYDVNAKANYRINKNNRIFLSGYFGRDKIGVGNAFGIDWGNATGTARWNHVFNSKWFSNTSLIYSNYDYKISIKSGTTDFDITSRIKDINFKHEFNFFPNPKNSIKIGINSIYHTVVPGQVDSKGTTGINDVKLQDRYAWENAIYASNEWKPSEKLSIIYGLRLTSFSALGKGDFYSYDSSGNVTATKTYGSGEFVKTYVNLEPRISASYLLGTSNSVKAAYARNVQNLHLISNSTTTSPTDLWVTSNNNIKPEISDQVSAGYFQNFDDNKYELGVEAYYKTMQNQIDYKNGANTQANDKIEGELLSGKGRAYGIELLLRKKTGRFTGWAGYTLSRTERKINQINNGNWYAARQDRTHDVSLVGMYDLTKRWTISGTWVYNTGNAVTFPSGKYTIDNQVFFSYTDRNAYRMPAYHRLDIGATYTKKRSDRRESSWSFSVYNAYGRQNAYSIDFEEDPNDASKTRAVQTSLFRWVPSITYNFKF